MNTDLMFSTSTFSLVYLFLLQANLFTPEEEPLKHSLQGRLILKTATVSLPLRPRISEIQRQKLRKNQQNRREKKALKRVEKEKCRHNSNFNVDVTKTDNNEVSRPDGLVFYEHHYGVSNDVIRRSGSDSSLGILVDAETDRQSGPMKPGVSTEARRMSQETENDINDDAEFQPVEETSLGLCVKGEDEITVEAADNISKKHSDSSGWSREEDGEIFDGDNVSLNTSSLAMPEYALNDKTEGQLSNLSSKENRYASCQKKKCAIIDSNRAELFPDGDKSCSEPRNHERKPLSVDGVEAIAHLQIDNESQVIKTTADNPTLIASTKSKFERHVLCVTGSDNSSPSVPCESLYPTEALVKGTDIQDGFSGFSTLIDKEGENHCISCARNEQCDFTIISSPRVLQLALKICSGHKVNEEEVGEANKFSRICLSGWHLQFESGSWVVVERGALHLDNDALSSEAKVYVSDRLEAFFNQENKLWTLVENEHIENELSSFTNEIQNEVVRDTLILAAATEDSPSDQDDIAEEQVVTPILSQSNSLEDINVTLLDSKVNDDGTENLTSVERPRATGADGVVGRPGTESSSQGALREATQRVFLHIVELREEPEEALDNTKHESLVENVCSPLCSALWNMLSIGVRRKFIVKYTLWNIVEELKDISGVIELAVNWVNNRCARLSDEQKFQAFVCECLNMGRDTLKQWLEGFIRQNRTRSDGKLGNKFYSEGGIVFQLSGNTLEELVLDLSRITCLPFKINVEKWIKTKESSLQEIPFPFE